MVTGTIRYGKLVIEEGGQLSGEIQFGTTPSRLPSQRQSLSRILELQAMMTNAGAATGLACGLQCRQRRHSQRQ
jgi:cytoskeletal protein CcmA (bactofilin family)